MILGYLKKNLFMLLLLYQYPCLGKILVFTYAYNRPDFIEIQYKTFKKFLQDDYEFVVFNDAQQEEMANQIVTMCERYGIRCIPIPQEIHGRPYLDRPTHGYLAQYNCPNVRNCNVVQYSLDTLGFKHDDIVALFDSDLFLVKEFSISQFMQDQKIACITRKCKNHINHICQELHPDLAPFQYIWIGLAFLNIPELQDKTAINFNCGFVHGNIRLDSGGYTYYYLDNLALNPKSIDRTSLKHLICKACNSITVSQSSCTHNTNMLKEIGLCAREIQLAQSMPLDNTKTGSYMEFILNGTFIHYCAGSNHSGFSSQFIEIKSKAMQQFINDILLH